MNLFLKRFVRALAFGAWAIAGSAHAADPADKKPQAAAAQESAKKAERTPEPEKKPEAASQSSEKKSDRASQRAERRSKPKSEPGSSQNELDTCKRDAQGKDGPERARFMTDCLGSR